MIGNEYRGKAWPMPKCDLSYVGRATTRKLKNHGIETIGQIANMDPELLQALYTGLPLDCEKLPILTVGDETIIKSTGNSTITPRDHMNELNTEIVFYMLAESVAERMRDHGYMAKTV